MLGIISTVKWLMPIDNNHYRHSIMPNVNWQKDIIETLKWEMAPDIRQLRHVEWLMPVDTVKWLMSSDNLHYRDDRMTYTNWQHTI